MQAVMAETREIAGFHCPVAGCSKAKENWRNVSPPFETRPSLRAHILAKIDDAHQTAKEQKVWYDLEPVDETITVGVDDGTDDLGGEEVRGPTDDVERDAGTGIEGETEPEDTELEGELTTKDEHRERPEGDSDEPKGTEVVESTESVQGIPCNFFIGAAIAALAVGTFLWWRRRRREPTQQALTESGPAPDPQPVEQDEGDTDESPALIER
jgi:hypothetical protein